MATNPFFATIAGQSETDLQESLVIENIQMFGFDITYIPLENFDIEPVLLDPKNIVYQRTAQIEVYAPDNGETEGQQELMSKFGFRVNKSLKLLMAKKRWADIFPDKVRPLEGDLIYIGDPYSPRESFVNALFEIKNVAYQKPEWPLGHHYTYELSCETYVANYEKFETGVPALDQFNMVGAENQDARDRIVEEIASNGQIETEKAPLVRFDRNNPLTGI